MRPLIPILFFCVASLAVIPKEVRETSQCRLVSHNRHTHQFDTVEPGPIEVQGKTITLHEPRRATSFEAIEGPILDPVQTSNPRRVWWIASDEVCVFDPSAGRARSAFWDAGLSGSGRLSVVDGRVVLKRIGIDSCLQFRATSKGAKRRQVACPVPPQ